MSFAIVSSWLEKIKEPMYEVSVSEVRVIISSFGNVVRMSAPQLDIFAEGSSRAEAWEKFLKEVDKFDDRRCLSFDIAPTRREEIERGLEAPEDEDWSEPFNGTVE